MTKQEYEESCRSWALAAHKEARELALAAAREDREFSRSLYEQRIEDMAAYISLLEKNFSKSEDKVL